MVGLSVSRCINELMLGVNGIKIEDVEKIIARTRCKSDADWEKVIELYKEKYWSINPEKAEKILRQLLKENKVEQPLLRKDYCCPEISNGIIWVESEDQIKWDNFLWDHEA